MRKSSVDPKTLSNPKALQRFIDAFNDLTDAHNKLCESHESLVKEVASLTSTVDEITKILLQDPILRGRRGDA